ncbi:stage II sporulation protein M [Candidatus Woesearchaeota archaeon]|nr:stage II sporulation protein M [Candidatus Woesearchaeota archaeon]
MVLELLINPAKVERKPWEVFFIGLVYSSIAIVFSMYVFKDYIGIVMVFLTTLACIYFVHKMLRAEERQDQPVRSELHILKEHGKALSVLMFLFLGFVVAFSLWHILLPADTSQQVFGIQERTIQCINHAGVEGCASGTQAAFGRIFANNVKVLLFTLTFAFFYGAGSIFILAWNAAVVGTAVGLFVRNSISAIAGTLGLPSIAQYFGVYSAGIMRYMTHGSFEILAYFMAALAGGIISIAVASHDFRSAQFRKVLYDSVDLIALSVGVLFLAAIIEVYITPLLF